MSWMSLHRRLERNSGLLIFGGPLTPSYSKTGIVSRLRPMKASSPIRGIAGSE